MGTRFIESTSLGVRHSRGVEEPYCGDPRASMCLELGLQTHCRGPSQLASSFPSLHLAPENLVFLNS